MFTQIQGPDQHFNAYYQDNALVIQFVIAEFVDAHHLICHIKGLIDRSLLTNQQLDESIHPLFHSLTQLLGSLSNQEHVAVSRWTKGPLTKMKDYCEQFSHNTSELDKSHLSLHSTVYQTWLTAVHNLELVSTLRLSRTMTKNLSFTTHIRRTLNGLLTRLNMVTKQIPRVANFYWDNENVVYFLMRRKKQLIEIYGEEWAKKLFKSFVKQSSLTPGLIQRYKERGFENLDLELAEEVLK